MVDRSLSFKYWIEFGDDGEILNFHKNKYDCRNECEEFVVKLIPIKRNVMQDVERSTNKLSKTLKQTSKQLDTEFNKLLRDLKGALK